MFFSYTARVAMVLARSLPQRRISIFDEVRLPMWVWPTDIDLYFHLNNGAYLTMMDIGRYQLALRTGLFSVMWRRKTWPLLGGSIVRYRRDLKVFQRVCLTTRLVGWEGKWFFVEQRFERDDVVHAAAVHKVVMRKAGQSLPFAEIAEELGVSPTSPTVPDLAAWQTVLSGKSSELHRQKLALSSR
jgi:acyl-CoA thioesterase FadM